ncbi:hypothetical protein [uncultured Thiohalocapsa sp.]|uniref:hypothetical protein n=1 Tax=uncultured Thiohalocapsa sp. TaxID=768990 RepID=UPI0025FEB3B3|nr:hypothetical protein [uncultured Thiohalocapsa sp.]
MNRHNFPTIAIAVSVPLLLIVIFGGGPAPGETRVPLLALLLASELGLIINAVGAYFGLAALRTQPRPRGVLLRLAANLVLALDFGANLLAYWPG